MKFTPSITFLRYFFSAGQANSISKAAKENFVSQSAISQAISKLEAGLGKQLITHEKNRLQLTSDGFLLLEKCKKLLAVLSEIEDVFNEREGVYKGKLTLACTHSFALSLLPPILGQLSHLWEEVEPVLRLGHTGMIVDLVKKGDVDFGIVIDNEDFSSFRTREVYQGEYRLYQGKNFTAKEDSPFILSEERKEISMLRHFFHSQGIKMNRSMEVSSWEVIASLTEQGLGIGFLPDYIVGKRQLLPYNSPLNIPYRLLAISLKNKELSRNVKMFIELMANSVEKT